MIPNSVLSRIESITGTVQNSRSVGGGCIAHATRVETGKGVFFLKWADREAGRSFFAEQDGLAALRTTSQGLDLVVPEPLIAENSATAPGFLLMEWIEPGRPQQEDWRAFGRVLAELHRKTIKDGNGRYGYAADNWIGSKPQKNGWDVSWPNFFGEKRLLAQAETVRKRGAWRAQWDKPLENLVGELDQLLPEKPHPSLLHGDLWGGNALPAADGRFAIIDPAVYVGHREADLAMTELFGGFAPSFYEGYNETWPLEPGYPERREMYNLFHLINHLTHGPGYAVQVEKVLKRFGSL
ncbi:MAG: fructosamine kinase family protein [Rubricoccaceae bacterium]|nr:fructosamine kinase family protein [Rubricoccaceae bacterium]